MKRIKQLTARFRKQQHPAQALGEFLQQHSNSPEYLVAVLSAFRDAARDDDEAEQEAVDAVIRGLGFTSDGLGK